ncbi:ABC transporter ATP-binding protein [uncultured Subdoligranulum sp.]|uniref:ABC transporter ATP-binding protein n=1 Tax=uncultured Subdoligranulum sp. TaxID=512298 RepID=UPI0026177FC6|nr:ABC transporter ATP-binding protein [uncultured Subdoligranulum sp.]
MLNIFRHLFRHWATILAVVALLLVQASCDLALPGYTSDIVDVGIQQGGVDSALPDMVRAGTLEALEALMRPEDAALAEQWYGAPDENGLRTLAPDAEAARAELEQAFTLPDVLLYQAAAALAADRQGVESALPEAQDLDAAVAALGQTLGRAEQVTVTDATLAPDGADPDAAETSLPSQASSQAVQFVRLEYEAQGVAGDVQMRYLLATGGGMLLIALLMAAAAISVGFLAARVSAAIGRDLRRQVFGTVIHFSNTETDRFSTASLITRTTNDIQQVQMTAVMLLRIVIYAPILGIGGIIRVSRTDTSLSWIIVLAVVLLMVLVFVLMQVALPKFKIMQKLVDRLNLVSREILTGIMPIRAFSREQFEEQRFDAANRDLMRTQLFTNRTMTFMMPAMTLIMNGVSLLIIWFGGHAMVDGGMQVGDLIAFITYTMQIVMSFLMLTVISIMLPRAGVAADRIEEVLRTEPVIEDPAPARQADGLVRKQWQGVVRFDHVDFRFPGADTNVLEDITFTAEPGKTTAIIGSTGCGKSTLLNLIPRFYDVSGGSITLDGVDLRAMPQETLRAQLGYVPQKGVLFSGTIESNLKFGGDAIPDAAMEQAAAIAQAAAFIAAKPQGYQSPIAQGGTNVSGGQKQRLSIARAIAKSPRVYLFDDSFSALDYKTDAALRRALAEKTGDATVIIVAQRISTVLHADQILVLDEGRIVGRGRHAELLAHCPEYREIARSQLSERDLAMAETSTKGGDV